MTSYSAPSVEKAIFPQQRMKRSITKTSDIARYIAVLQDEKRELSVGLGRRWDIAAVSSPDSVEDVQLAEVRELGIDSLDRQAGLLREVQDALSRISDNSFGVCRLCDATIKPTRLNAVPWAALCIDCQESAEKTHGINGRFLYKSFDDAA